MADEDHLEFERKKTLEANKRLDFKLYLSRGRCIREEGKKGKRNPAGTP